MKHDWEYKKLGDISKIASGKSIEARHIKSEYHEGLYYCYGGNGVRGFVDKFSYEGMYPIIGRVGALCGNVHLAEGRFYATEHALVVRILQNTNPYWLTFQLKALNLRSIAKGVAQPVISAKEVSSISIPVPPLPVQQQIVDELDKLSEIIEKKKQQVKELDTLAQSIFYDMFGDPNINEKKWETKKLSNLCINLDSQRKPITAKDRVVGSFPYYGASGIVDYVEGYILDGEYLLVSEDGANLLLRHTPIAFVAKGKIWVNNHAHILEFDNKKLQSFVEYFFKYLDISHLITGCAQPKLTQGNLNNIEIFFPSNTLIDSFAQKIEAIEKQKELINQSIKETQTLFDSRMDYYFGE